MTVFQGPDLSGIYEKQAAGVKLGPHDFDTPPLSLCPSFQAGKKFDDTCAFISAPAHTWRGGNGHAFTVYGPRAVDGPTLDAMMTCGEIEQGQIYTRVQDAKEDAENRNLQSWLAYARACGNGSLGRLSGWSRVPAMNSPALVSRPNPQPVR